MGRLADIIRKQEDVSFVTRPGTRTNVGVLPGGAQEGQPGLGGPPIPGAVPEGRPVSGVPLKPSAFKLKEILGEGMEEAPPENPGMTVRQRMLRHAAGMKQQRNPTTEVEGLTLGGPYGT